MYKVMLVDDDYPVLELLTETIDWDSMGVEIHSTHENGLSAFERASQDMPDILITDIGMPKMNGIELTRKLKEINRDLQVVLLSCHTDFDYAHQALKLQVQDYLVKDTFEPEDLCSVIKKFKDKLNKQEKEKWKETQLQIMLSKKRKNEKEKFFSKMLDPSYRNELEWKKEKDEFGLGKYQAYFVAMLTIHSYKLPSNWIAEDVLKFALHNILDEILMKFNSDSIHFSCRSKKIFICFPADLGYKVNALSNAEECIKLIHNAIEKTLKIAVSTIIGNKCESFQEYKEELQALNQSEHQLFYMHPKTIEKKMEIDKVQADLFAKYDEAATEMRVLVMKKEEKEIEFFIDKWMEYISTQKFSPEIIKDWILKLLLDLRVKLQALQFFTSDYVFELKHQEVFKIEYLYELKEWLREYFHSLFIQFAGTYEKTKRREIIDAFRYVTMNLERKITLDEISSFLFLNPSYFSRLFKKEVGETFVEYVTRMKINRAKELLEQTDESVGKICERLGYDNQSYFIKLFKTNAGKTPLDYRSGKVL